MFPLRSAALGASVVALAFASAAHASTAAGGSCAHPHLWHLTDAQVAEVAGPPVGTVRLSHRDITLVSDRNDPYAVGPRVTVTSAGASRVCSIRGYYSGGHSFLTPASVRHSTATRWFASTGAYAPRALVVAYAAHSTADGRSCENPLVVFGDTLHDDGVGDLGARIRAKRVSDGSGRARTLAEWQTAAGSHTCAVHGWDRRGHAFTLRAPRDGSHAMSDYAVVGNHDNPLVYLWIEFRR